MNSKDGFNIFRLIWEVLGCAPIFLFLLVIAGLIAYLVS